VRVQFEVDVGQLDGYRMRALKRAIVDQADEQGFHAVVLSSRTQLKVTLDGPEGWIHAYEAAIRSWAADQSGTT
jgi:hypothetical protein